MRTPLEVIRAYAGHDYTLAGLLASRAAAQAARSLFLCGSEETSYAAFGVRVEAAARALAGRGIVAGDRCGIMAGNSTDYVVLLFALARLGAILVPVNPEFGAREAGYILQHAGVRALAVVPTARDAAREATAAMSPQPWIFSLEDLPRSRRSRRCRRRLPPTRSASCSTPRAPPDSPRA